MKYLKSDEYDCVYWLEDGLLFYAPEHVDGSFSMEDGGAVERPHEEVPESYYNKVIKELAR